MPQLELQPGETSQVQHITKLVREISAKLSPNAQAALLVSIAKLFPHAQQTLRNARARDAAI